MPGLVPGIHVLQRSMKGRRGWPGHLARRRASRFYPVMTASKTSQSTDGRHLSRQRGLGLFSDRLKRRRLVDGEIRQHLAVDRNARLGQAVDKDAVGHAERAHRGVDALDPQRAEGAFLALAVAKGVLPGLLDRGLGGADGVLAAAVKTLGGLVDFLVLGVRGHTAFDARHDGSPLIARMGDGLPRERGSAKWDGIAFFCDQAFGKKYFLMLSPSVLNST